MSAALLPRRSMVASAVLGIAAGVPMARGAPASRTLIGTYGGAGSTGVPEVAAYEAWLGRPVDLVLDFVEDRTWQGMVHEAGWLAGCWRDAGRKQLVVSVPMLVQENGPTLAQGASGAFDDHYRDLGRTLAENGYGTSFVRIGWEFNGDWYRWSARGKTDDFKAYWRRIALAMRSVPGTRFRFDWCPNASDGPAEEAYPGDDVVDVIGLDIYNASWPIIDDPARRWAYLLHRPNGLGWHRDFAHARGKPRSFPEWGTGTRPDGHGGGDDPLFIRNMLAWFKEGDPVSYACYWNYRAPDYDAKLSDGRLPQAAEAFREGMRV